jgi:hypothetical protein
MITEAIDLANEISLTADINILKKEINLLDYAENINKKIISIPATYTLFRKYYFPFKDKNKIKKALEGNLKLELPLPFEESVYRYLSKEDEKGVHIFCFIIEKEFIEKHKQPVNTTFDTEILAILRTAKINGILSGEIIHYNRDYIIQIKFEELFPTEIRIHSTETQFEPKENRYFSGIIPENIKSKIITNPTNSPIYNIAYGLLLNPIDELSLDFSYSQTAEYIKKAIKGNIYLFLSILILNIALLIGIFVKNKEIKQIKEAEKEIYIKYINPQGEVYDPLMQAKGLLSSIKSGNTSFNIDPIELLSKIGLAKKTANISDLEKIDIVDNSFTLQGIANSLTDIEKFEKYLSKDFNISIDETTKLENGKIRFIIKGSK